MGPTVAKKLIQAHLLDGDMVPGQESGQKLSSLIASAARCEFPRQFGSHCLFTPFPGIGDDPTDTERLSSGRSHFLGYLVCRAANPPGFNLHLRFNILHSLLKDL